LADAYRNVEAWFGFEMEERNMFSERLDQLNEKKFK